jgi:hypothetical protein
MQEIWQKLIDLESTLTPQARWSLTALLAMATLNCAVGFGESLGRALYYLTH